MALNLMLLLGLPFFLYSFVIQTCYCQSSSPQNIETFYPIQTPAPATEPATAAQPPEPPPNPQPPPPPPLPELQAPGPRVSSKSSSSSNSKLAKAVAATAASTVVVSGLIFLLLQKCLRARRRKGITNTATSAADRRVVPQGNVFERIDGNVKGLIVDEEGLDVIYWRKLEGKDSNKDFQKEVFSSPKNKDDEEEDDDDDEGNQGKKYESIQEIHMVRGKSSTSHMNIFPEEAYTIMRISPPAPPPTFPASVIGVDVKDVQKPDSPGHSSTPSPPPPSPPTSPSTSFSSIPKMASPASPPPPPPSPSPPPIPDRKSQAPSPPTQDRKGQAPSPPTPDRKGQAPPPPPPPPIPARKGPAPPPPPPPIPGRKSPAPPNPPPKTGIVKSSSKPPPTPIETPETSNGQVKLKPLHWDKVNTNADHSMVWDKMDRGSFRVDDDLMEALFGYVATNRKSPKANDSMTPGRDALSPSTKVFILDPRKSQNIAIVLKSLGVSREKTLDAIINGQGLNTDIIEKLARVAPTEEEQSLILEYNGDPARLAAAESFLHHILKAVPSAFKRLNAMLFRLNYDLEILEIKESLRTLDLGCKELRNRGVFVKLLEAVLKAGNRMNAGTSRGNAQAFNLASLRKLSDVKSTDGRTTLLHFVVEEVVRSEGKRAVLNSNRSLSRSGSRSSNSSGNSENSAASDEQREREYIMLGLPIVGGISSEFSNVKKAALTDYKSFVGSISALSARIVETRELVSQCGNDDKGGNFAIEMEHFLGNAEEELKMVREEQTRVMQLVKRTTDYYQGGASKDSAEKPLHLFVIVKDFLGMVDQACIEIARNMQKRKAPRVSSG